MKKVLCCLSTLMIVLFLAGCTPADVKATDEAARLLAIATGKSEDDIKNRRANRVSSRMCEGEQVAVALMLENAGYSSNLDSYNSLWVVDMIDDEGNNYRVLYIDDIETVVIPDRYRN